MTQTGRWYLQRARSMGPPELIWRATSPVRRRTPASTTSRVATPRPAAMPAAPDILRPEAVAEAARQHPEAASAVLAAAERFSRHEFCFFGQPSVSLGAEMDWHLDPFTGYRWPDSPSHKIDYRFSGQDPKWIWELNRLQHLPMLVEAWMMTDDARFAERAMADLRSWIEANPLGRGIAWQGGFEAGVRAISVAVALQGLRHYEGLDSETDAMALGLLEASARKAWLQRSLFSSANNHLIGEMGGLAISSILFPELEHAGRNRTRALRVLAREAARQIRPDGSGAEQSLRYHLFTADVLLLVVALLRQAGPAAPEPLLDALVRSTRFLTSLVHPGETAPWYGDDDESFALRLQWERTREVGSHLAAVKAVLAGSPHEPAEGFEASLLQRRTGRSPVERPERPEKESFYAENAGLVVLRGAGRRVLVDAGPLGLPPLAAHGHADALSVTVEVQQTPVVVDTGTGSYYRHRQWREAHRSTRMHATLEVDGENQSVAGGLFLWTQHAQVRVRHVDLELGLVEAEHTGYSRLADAVLHRRWVLSPPDDERTYVVDWCEAAGRHRYRVGWPLDPRLTVTAHGDGHVVSLRQTPVMQLSYGAVTPFQMFAAHGEPAGDAGWASGHLEERIPAWHVGTTSEGKGPWAHVTVLRDLGTDEPRPEPLSVELRGRRLAIRSGDARSLTVDLDRPGAVVLRPGTS